jgi:peroxiredoxin Q/BCP
MKPIRTGDHIPQFILEDQYGKIFNVNEYLGKGRLLITFCARGEALGCDTKACNFCNNRGSFGDSDISMIGITSQTHVITTETSKRLMNYPILKDTEGKVRELFGIASLNGDDDSGRITYIVDHKGIVTGILAANHLRDCRADEALKIDLHIKKSDTQKA